MAVKLQTSSFVVCAPLFKPKAQSFKFKIFAFKSLLKDYEILSIKKFMYFAKFYVRVDNVGSSEGKNSIFS